MLDYVEARRELACKLTAALEEVSQALDAAKDLGYTGPEGLKEGINDACQMTRVLSAQLTTVCASMRLTSDAILLQGACPRQYSSFRLLISSRACF